MLGATLTTLETAMHAFIPAVLLAFHHVFVDGVWWLRFREPAEDDGIVGALYLVYYAPLFAGLVLYFVNSANADAAAIIVIVVTTLHYVVGAWKSLLSEDRLATIRDRYTNRDNAVADGIIVVGLVVASFALENHLYVYPAIVAALIGNTFCIAGQTKMPMGLRLAWVSVLLVWGWLAILDQYASWWLGVIVATGVFAKAGWELLRHYKEGKDNNILFSHLLAGFFHAASSIALAIVVVSRGVDWRAP